VIRQEGRCAACGEPLEVGGDTQFDHVPALQLRGWDPEKQDTIPAANDNEAIQAKHKVCHARKTTGRKGESKLNAVHGDVAEIAKLRRLTRAQEDYRRRITAKSRGDDVEAEVETKKKSRWPKRSFSRGVARATSTTGSQDRDRSSDEKSRRRGLSLRDDNKKSKGAFPLRRKMAQRRDRENSEDGVPE
jgi:hypothetical protein